jgi:hypothetical protein
MRTQKKRFVKIVKAKIPWISHIVNENNAKIFFQNEIKIKIPRRSLCIYCKGSKMLCGKIKCPIFSKIYSFLKIKSYLKKEILGNSPPSIFIGRIGYPYVFAGPAAPPEIGDTSIYDTPELWLNKSFEEIIDFRFKLIRGKFLTNVKNQEKYKFVEYIQELAMSKTPVETEIILKNTPKQNIILDSEVQPFGPGGIIEDLKIRNTKTDAKIEKVYYDYDLKAEDAIIELYKKGLAVSKIQKAFSAGLFGIKIQRRLVPTRWSITAVDSIISENILEEIRSYPLINNFLVFEFKHLDRLFIVLLFPDSWGYELIEAWYPNTTWNPNDNYIAICSDGEDYWGRKNYPDIGGCYFSARLAVTEKLKEMKRQAKAIVLSEAYPGHILPLGVWEVRESVRYALNLNPKKFENVEEVLEYLSTRIKTPINRLIEQSKILKDFFTQKKIIHFLNNSNI